MKYVKFKNFNYNNIFYIFTEFKKELKKVNL